MTLEAGQAQRDDARASRRARDQEKIARAIEEELAVLKEARPHLEARIDRAAGILVMQLSSSPKARPIRVRTNGQTARFLVESLSEPGATYVVDPKTWSCTCRDWFRREAACKHAISSYLLWKLDRIAPRAPNTVPSQKGCDACRDNPGWVLVEEEIVDSETGEVTTAFNTVKCRRCQRSSAEPGLLTAEQMEEWMASVPWREATTYQPPHDHSYTLRKLQPPEDFDQAAKTIWWAGYDRHYLRRPWRTLHVGDFICWLWTRPTGPRHAYPQDTVVINRVLAEKARVV